MTHNLSEDEATEIYEAAYEKEYGVAFEKALEVMEEDEPVNAAEEYAHRRAVEAAEAAVKKAEAEAVLIWDRKHT